MKKFGFCALIGRPNVGKSTLLNRLVGQNVAITSPVVQTTRHRIKGILTGERGQVVFLDTPGFSKALDHLGSLLVSESEAGLADADLLMVVVDASQPAGKGDAWVMAQAAATGKPCLLVLNQTDRIKGKPEAREALRQSYISQMAGLDWTGPTPRVLAVSAKTGRNCDQLLRLIWTLLPAGEPLYPEDAITDQPLRQMAAELLREKVMRHTREELPHSVAVGVDLFDETSDPERTRITATLYVNQTSQQGILIGAGGQLIKTIGTEARKDLETLMERPVFLDLRVKVKANWRRDPKFLETLGLAPPGK